MDTLVQAPVGPHARSPQHQGRGRRVRGGAGLMEFDTRRGMSASMRRNELPAASAFGDAIRDKRSRRFQLPKSLSFWAAAAIAFLGFAANAAVSPLYRVYQVRFGFSPTTLTLLFTVYIVVL